MPFSSCQALAGHIIDACRQLVGNEHAAHKEFHLRFLRRVVVKHIKRRLLWKKEDRLELNLALRVQVRAGARVEVVLIIVIDIVLLSICIDFGLYLDVNWKLKKCGSDR